MDGREPLSIPDTSSDQRYPGVEASELRGYLGVPIVLGDGRVFGAFCAVDSEPMDLTSEQIAAMTSLATLLSYAIDVERLATHDRLTGLYNRSLFDDHLMVELARARRNGTMLAVIYVNLDQFKQINETSGQDLGRELLAGVGLRLRSTIRGCDTAARIGGDEFALILPDIRKVDNAARVAQALLESLQDPIRVSDNVFTMTASVGVAVYPLHGQNAKTLMECADVAMHAARAAGGSAFRFSLGGDNAGLSHTFGERPLLRVLPDPSDQDQ